MARSAARIPSPQAAKQAGRHRSRATLPAAAVNDHVQARIDPDLQLLEHVAEAEAGRLAVGDGIPDPLDPSALRFRGQCGRIGFHVGVHLVGGDQRHQHVGSSSPQGHQVLPKIAPILHVSAARSVAPSRRERDADPAQPVRRINKVDAQRVIGGSRKSHDTASCTRQAVAMKAPRRAPGCMCEPLRCYAA